MRRARHRLQPNTFPFIAVLLCAMGSLILFLLVLDRRAKVVARAKAEKLVSATLAQVREQELSREARAKRDAEWQRRREELHAYLLAQQAELLGQIDAVHGEKAKAQQQLAAKEGEHEQLSAQLDLERTRLEKFKGEIQLQQGTLTRAQEKSTKAKTALEQLASDLQQLEQALVNLQKLRTQQKECYSVVPYKGSRGDNRKPQYIECIPGGVIFHPEEVALTGKDFSPLNVRKELDRRIADRLREAGAEEKKQKPYLFVLLRPDGLYSYYALGTALAGLAVDLGYELIDRDWVLDFSAGKVKPGASAVAMALPPAVPEGSGKMVQGFKTNFPVGIGLPPPPPPPDGPPGDGPSTSGLPWRPKSGTGGQAGANGMPAGQGTAGGTPGAPNPGGKGPGLGTGLWPGVGAPPWTQGNVAGAGDPQPSAPGIPGTGSSGPVGGVPGSGKLAGSTGPFPGSNGGGSWPTGPGNSSSAAKPGDIGLPPPPVTGAPPFPAGGNAGSPGANSGSSSSAASGSPGGSGNSGGKGGSPGNGSGAGSGDVPGDGVGSHDALMPALPPVPDPTKPKAKRPPVILGKVVSNRDWNVPIDCTAQGLTLLLTGQHFSLATLQAKAPGEHPLHRAIRELIARKQALVRPGDPPYRPLLYFEVPPAGLRAYLLAYDVLEDLNLAVVRHNVPAQEQKLEDYYRK